MDWVNFLMISSLFGVAIYLLLDRALLHVVMGVMVLSNALNLLIILTSGTPQDKGAPILEGAINGPLVDPLPQALVLTAIVIGFGMLAFFAAFIYTIFNNSKTDDLNRLFERKK